MLHACNLCVFVCVCVSVRVCVCLDVSIIEICRSGQHISLLPPLSLVMCLQINDPFYTNLMLCVDIDK